MNTPIPVVRPREWLFVVVFAVIALLITTLPYANGFARSGSAGDPGAAFGGFLFGVEDGNSYLAKMRQGARGSWSFRIVYTTEPHEGAFLFAPYLLMGAIANTTDTDRLMGVFHAARILCGALLIGVLYLFIARYLPGVGARRVTLILICFGGGLGWLVILVGLSGWDGLPPLDTYLPEGYTFYLLYGLPHLSLARAALLGGFLCIFHAAGLSTSHQRPAMIAWSIAAGVSWLVMGLCVPFYIGVLYVLLAIWGLAVWIRERRFPLVLLIRIGIAAAIPAPYLLYSYLSFSRNAVFTAWQAQNVLPSPPPLHYLPAYGLIVLLAVLSLRAAWRKTRIDHVLIVGWVVAMPLLAYFPVAVQRRMLEGIYVPLGILAVMTIWRLGRRRWIAVITVCSALFATNFLLLFNGLMLTSSRATSVFVPAEQREAFGWLEVNAEPGEAVLSTAYIGNRVPAYTDLIVYVGHGPETVDYGAKRARAEQFLSGAMSADQAVDLLTANRIRYVVACAGDPRVFADQYAGLLAVFENSGESGCAIYEVVID